MNKMYVEYCVFRAYAAVEQYVEAEKFSRERLRQIVSATMRKNLGDYNSAVHKYNEVMLEAIEFLNNLYEHLPKSMDEIQKMEELASNIACLPEKLSDELKTVKKFIDNYREYQRFAKKQAESLIKARVGIAGILPEKEVQRIVFNIVQLYGKSTTQLAICRIATYDPIRAFSNNPARMVVNQVVFRLKDGDDTKVFEVMLLLAGPLKKELDKEESSPLLLPILLRSLNDRRIMWETETIELIMSSFYKHKLFDWDEIHNPEMHILDLKSRLWVQHAALMRMNCQNKNYCELIQEQQQKLGTMIKTALDLAKIFPVCYTDRSSGTGATVLL